MLYDPLLLSNAGQLDIELTQSLPVIIGVCLGQFGFHHIVPGTNGNGPKYVDGKAMADDGKAAMNLDDGSDQ